MDTIVLLMQYFTVTCFFTLLLITNIIGNIRFLKVIQ